MNEALRKEKINRSYKKNETSKTYEKISFEGHQVKSLLQKGPDGKMAIERVLEAIWPGAVEDDDVAKVFKVGFVPRTIEVWRQWAVVEKLMSERFPDKLKEDVIGGEDGFARFGKECREFIFRFQSMSTEDYSKSYYLHTLMDHAGDFMRALEQEGFTLGMMSNSGAERRHEYGRRASRKALASNGWRKKKPEYDKMENLLVYLTLTEVLIWDYGEDLLSYTMARLQRDGHLTPPSSSNLLKQGKVTFQLSSRKEQLKEDEERMLSGKSREPLLTQEEADLEYAADPDDAPATFETVSKFWKQTGKKKEFALDYVQPDFDEDVDQSEFDPDHKNELYSLVPIPFSDEMESVAGSEEDYQTVLTAVFGDDDSEDDAEFDVAEGDEQRELAEEALEWELESEEEANLKSRHDETVTGKPRRLRPRQGANRPVLSEEAHSAPGKNMESGYQVADTANPLGVSAPVPASGVSTLAPGSDTANPTHPVAESGRADGDGARRAVPTRAPTRARARGRGRGGPAGAGAGRGRS
jgi:hypothetical protein